MRRTMKWVLGLALTIGMSGLALASAPMVPNGWAQSTITMGTIFDNSPTAEKYAASQPVPVLFNYTGRDGAGDRGTVVQPTKIENTLNSYKGMSKQVLPVFVVYTADASGGGAQSALADINQYKNLKFHYETLILAITVLEKEAAASIAPIKSTVILNPDFIGNLHKEGMDPTQTISITQQDTGKTYTVAQVLQDAIADLQGQGELPQGDYTIPDAFQQATTLATYVQSINWLMGEFAPKVDYGWEDADWAGQASGNNWLHGASTGTVAANAEGEISYIRALDVFAPVDTDNGTTAPMFIAFDKYGANPVVNGNANNVGMGYLFNNSDWNNYMQFTSTVAKAFNQPLMLFQMPGAHLPDANSSSAASNVATMPDYVFGSAKPLFLNRVPGTVSAHNYHVDSDMAPAQYLLADAEHNPWLQQTLATKARIEKLKSEGVFAILWGGGAWATGVIPQGGDTLDDNGWLYQQIQSAAATGLVTPVQDKTLPPVDKLPVFPAGGPYTSGSYVTTNGEDIYQCKVANWCNAINSSYAPGAANSNMAWNKLK